VHGGTACLQALGLLLLATLLELCHHGLLARTLLLQQPYALFLLLLLAFRGLFLGSLVRGLLLLLRRSGRAHAHSDSSQQSATRAGHSAERALTHRRLLLLLEDLLELL
jgi:hypothetical protein